MKPTPQDALARLLYLRDRVLVEPEDKAAVDVVIEHLKTDPSFGNPFPPPPPPTK